jgi:hypothetical protein
MQLAGPGPQSDAIVRTIVRQNEIGSQVSAGLGRTPLFEDVGLILIGEVAQGGQDRIGCHLTKGAQEAGLDASCFSISMRLLEEASIFYPGLRPGICCFMFLLLAGELTEEQRQLIETAFPFLFRHVYAASESETIKLK